jgi:hypothetical protein
MPLEIFQEPGPRWDGGDFYNTSACASFSATPLQIATSAGAGYCNYISTITFSSPSAQCITIWDGASANICKLYTTALNTTQLVFPRGMELRVPTVGSNIKALSDVSATTYFTITGTKKPYTA